MAWRKPKNLREWFGIIGRHKKKFFFPAVTVAIGVIWASHWMPREYRAEAKFERLNDATLREAGGGTTTMALAPIRQAMFEDLMGRPAVERLIKDLQLTRDLPHTDTGELTPDGKLAEYDLIQKLRRDIKAYYQSQSNDMDQVVVTYNSEDPTLSPQVVNRLIENYIRETRAQLNDVLINAKGFFERQKGIYQGKVAELETKKMRFELDHPGLTPNDPASIQTKLVDLQSKLGQVTQELQVTAQKRERLKEWATRQPPELKVTRKIENPAMARVLEKRMGIQNELEANLAAGRTEEHPQVKRLRERLAIVDREMAALEPEKDQDTLEPNTQKLAAEQQIEELSGTVQALERRQQELTGQVDQYEALQRNFFVVRNDYIKLTRDLDESQQQFTFWDGNLRRAQVALSIEVQNRGVRLRMIQPAPELARPSKPTLYGILVVGILAGCAAGALFVLLAELLDHSFHSIEQAVDDLKLPVLGAVNEIITPAASLRRRILAFFVYPTVGAAMSMVLLIVAGITYLNLEQPLLYAQLVSDPLGFLMRRVTGGS
jgi:uncharacterized protein involved in exopolysaccharide biosynthesis